MLAPLNDLGRNSGETIPTRQRENGHSVISPPNKPYLSPWESNTSPPSRSRLFVLHPLAYQKPEEGLVAVRDRKKSGRPSLGGGTELLSSQAPMPNGTARNPCSWPWMVVCQSNTYLCGSGGREGRAAGYRSAVTYRCAVRRSVKLWAREGEI